MRALAIGSDDAAGRVKEEEAPLAEEDRPVVGRGEHLEDLRLRSHADRVSKPFYPVDADEWNDQGRDLANGETEHPEEAESQDRPSPPARDCVACRSKPEQLAHLRRATTEE